MPNQVLCMKWGNKYPALFVNRLQAMLQRHLSLPFELICFTDDPRGIVPEVQCLPLPPVPLPEGLPERGWRKLGLFQADLYGLSGSALFLDLDVVILRNMDHFFQHEADSEALYIIRDWKRPWRGVGNSSVFRFKIGSFPQLLPHFSAHFDEIRRQFRNEQAFLSAYVRERQRLRYWAKNWCLSYKYHALAPPLLDYFLAPRQPDCDILVFHGEINPDRAIMGGGGKWYRHIQAAPWLAQHWREEAP